MIRFSGVLICFVALLCLVSGVLADLDGPGRMDVTLPNGVVVRDVPDDITQTELKRRAIAGGIITEEDFPPNEKSDYGGKQESGLLSKAADFIGDLFSGEDDPRKRDRECRQMAIARYNELLEEAMFDPDEQWALDGFESPRHYARAYSDGTYRLCMD